MLESGNDRGYTLIELMVAMVISGILIAAVSATYVAQNRASSAQGSVAEMNTQSKTSHNIIANTIREAGFVFNFNMPDSPASINGFNTIITPLEGGGAATDAITIIAANNIGQLWPVGVGPGDIDPCGAFSGVVDTANVDVVLAQDASDTPNNAERSHLILDIDYANVVSTSPFGFTVTLANTLSHSYPLMNLLNPAVAAPCDTGRPVYLLEDTTYCVDGSSNLRKIRFGVALPACAGIPGSSDEIIAENIDDLQFAYAVDMNEDGDIDDSNGNNIVDDADFIDGGLVTDNSRIKAVRINILARSDRTSINYSTMGNPPALIENRAYVPTSDAFKRRWLRSIIVRRNSLPD